MNKLHNFLQVLPAFILTVMMNTLCITVVALLSYFYCQEMGYGSTVSNIIAIITAVACFAYFHYYVRLQNWMTQTWSATLSDQTTDTDDPSDDIDNLKL